MGHVGCWSPSLLVVVVVLILTAMTAIGTTRAALTPLVHMTNHCYKTVPVNESLILDLTDNLQADRVMVGHLSCAVTLRAPPEARVYLHVLQLAISDHAQMPDRLHIYDVSSSGTVSKRLTPSTGLYGVLERPFLIYNTAGMIVPDFRSAGQRMRLDYQGKPTIIYRGFRVLVTVFYTPDQKGKCRPGTVHCPYAGTCVPLAVRCDSFPNCGLDDNADEKSCQREYVVSNVLDEYATRTAVIAAVTGIAIFLGVAAIVLVVVVRYSRKKHGRNADQAVRYTSEGGGACEYKNETDLTQQFAPPSYKDVVSPQGGGGSPYGHRHRHRHCDPPPAYSTVAAALVHHEDGNVSSEEEVNHSRRPASLWSHPAPPPHSHHLHPPRSQRQHPSTRPDEGRKGVREGEEEEEEEQRVGVRGEEDEEDVRMHGTWPSDTDEEEEVRARRRRKGGKGKGRGKHSGGKAGSGGGPTTSKGVSEAREDDRSANLEDKAQERTQPTTAPACEPNHTPTSPSNSECSPGHGTCPSAGTSDVASRAGSGCEVVSETESQLASGSKRNSRTESNSPDSCSSSHSDSPAKHPPPPARSKAADNPHDLLRSDPAVRSPPLADDEDFVDLNPSRSSQKECLLPH
ncbi:uncharacterized protein LOC143284739 [Babylonia areolata]|uniref:uncharacterized protein LOC143284739 n=1 Tax=Babylonia areolata TaxID=304850 RepID=UPI003FD08018